MSNSKQHTNVNEFPSFRVSSSPSHDSLSITATAKSKLLLLLPLAEVCKKICVKKSNYCN